MRNLNQSAERTDGSDISQGELRDLSLPASVHEASNPNGCAVTPESCRKEGHLVEEDSYIAPLKTDVQVRGDSFVNRTYVTLHSNYDLDKSALILNLLLKVCLSTKKIKI
jgi:hypothetical protein